MGFEILDPSHEAEIVGGERPPWPADLVGRTVGFVSNGKEGTRGFFAHLERLLRSEFGVAEVVLRTKANYSAPASEDDLLGASGWGLAVSGLGD